ncbi:OmpA family protein [Mesorhizobium sp. CC13]|uniref:OmpA family protein n=1 Tax=Mesorhizobium sp. CC13 TaxID=3029194 RepID=UPI003264CB88
MKRQSRILAGTAIGLFMASAPLGAMPMVETAASGRALPLIRVQVECQEGESAEACAARGAQEAAPEQPRRKKRQAEEQQQQEQAAPEAEPQPQQAEEPQPRRKQKRQVEEQQQQEQAAPEAEPQPQQAEEPQPRRKQKRQVEEQQQQEQAAPEAEPQPQQAEEPQPSRKQKRKVEELQQQEQPAIQAEPQPQPTEEPAKQAEEPAKQGEEPVKKRKLRAQEQTPAEQPAEQAEKPAEATPLPTTPEAPAGEAPAQAEKPAGPGTEQPVQAEKPAEGEQKPVQQGEAPVNPNEAPLLDSQKEAPPPAQAGGEQPAQEGKPLRKLKPGQQPAQQEQPAEQTAQPAPVDLGPPPTDDRQAQEAAQPVEIKPVTAEQGTRLERAPEIDLRRRPRPEGTEVVREIGDRLIIEINNQIIVESNDRPRLTRNAQDVYYEELPGGRTREVIIRDNGNQIITIRNRYGDIVRRSRITPDGREYVLTYVDDRYYEEMDEWRDPGLDLPPLELHIPRDEYILEAEYVDDPDAYYDFLEQPPVERVKRLYSVDEVKRSARVRDIARRIDLDTLTFEFGSASIPESEVTKLEGVANAMERMLKKNPAETFLIEGHTDAVGSDVANLALSDRRAEAVADALTNVFGIPPENLSTQGYGERYLKVKTEAPERDNRRVAIRRITPLVAPIASAN